MADSAIRDPVTPPNIIKMDLFETLSEFFVGSKKCWNW